MLDSPQFLRACMATAITAALSACGGGGGGGSPPPPPSQSEDSAAAKCSALASVQVPAQAIALGTRGATMESVELIPAGGEGRNAHKEYCKVVAAIAPIDPYAPPIRMQLNLPSEWNGKAYMQGGGGYNGSIPVTTAATYSTPLDKPSALARGYATFSGDSGHTGATSQDGQFGMNDEALNNFAKDALKKTRDAAVYLIEQRYGKGPEKSYFFGGSTGGREGLAFVQNWPQDFDGVISLFPAWNAATLDLFFGAVTRPLAATGGYLSVAQQDYVYQQSVDTCDADDGVADGIISRPDICSFDPVTILCSDPLLSTSATCLSQAQIDSLRKYDTRLDFSGFTLASGETSYPGFPVLAGAHTGGALGLNTAAPTHPSDRATQPYFTVFWDQFVRYFITRDPSFNYLNFSAENPPVGYRPRLSALTALMDINKTDLSAFKARGGKLILIHGLADALVSHRSTIDYYERVQRTMTAPSVDEFVRFYTIPGYGHAAGPFPFNMAWDSLTAIEEWVEKGAAPVNPVATDINAATFGRTRPMCTWPMYPRYIRGAPDLAASYACTNP